MDTDTLTESHTLTCYQCEEETTYLFDDSRCGKCTRLTPDEVVNGVKSEDEDEDDAL